MDAKPNYSPVNFYACPNRTDVAFAADADPMEMRRRILALQERMLSMTGERVDLAVNESLKDGLYTRTLIIPKGTLLVGKIHRKPCVNIVAKGDISVLTETGSMRVQAGYSITSPAGIQKVGYAHEDTIFINVFRTDETDIAKIEADLIIESFEALECEIGDKLCLG